MIKPNKPFCTVSASTERATEVSHWVNSYLRRSHLRRTSGPAGSQAEQVTHQVDHDDEDDQREEADDDGEGEVAAVVRRVVRFIACKTR